MAYELRLFGIDSDYNGARRFALKDPTDKQDQTQSKIDKATVRIDDLRPNFSNLDAWNPTQILRPMTAKISEHELYDRNPSSTGVIFGIDVSIIITTVGITLVSLNPKPKDKQIATSLTAGEIGQLNDELENQFQGYVSEEGIRYRTWFNLREIPSPVSGPGPDVLFTNKFYRDISKHRTSK